MINLLKTISFTFLLACSLLPLSTLAKLTKIIPKLQQGVVAIAVETGAGPSRLGTGFAVGDGSLVATNLHMLKQDIPYLVMRGEQKYNAQIVGKDPQHDIAVLKLYNNKLTPLQLSNCNCAKAGESYAFMGYPQQNMIVPNPITHTALVSAVANTRIATSTSISVRHDPYKIYQLQANVYPGNSGSPLFDPQSGQVVAMIYKFLVRGDSQNVHINNSGIGYAMPIIHLQKLLHRISG